MIKYESSWDDGGASDVKIADLMRRHKISSIFYWPTNWQKVNAKKNRQSLSPDEARTIAFDFEIGSHGVNHELLTQVDVDTAFYEISASRGALEELFQRPVDKFCYPRGYFNNDIKALVRASGYKQARTVQVGYLDPGADPFEIRTTVHVGYNRKEYDGLTWLEYAIKKAAEAQERSLKGEDVTYHFWGHSFELDKYNGWDDLVKLLKHIDGMRG